MTPRARGFLAAAALVLAATAAILFVSFAPLGSTKEDAEIPAVLRAEASTEMADAPASAVLDSRSGGGIASSWRPLPEDTAPWIEVRSLAPLVVRAVAVRLANGDPSSLRLAFDGGSALAPTEVSARDAIFVLDSERSVARWRLKGAVAVSRIEPLVGRPTVVVLDRDGGGDALLEILRGYGVPAAWMPALTQTMGDWLPEDAWVALSAESPPPQLIAALLDFVKTGGGLLETSSASPVCAPPSVRVDNVRSARLEGPAFDEPIAYPGALADETPCQRCTDRRVLLEDEAQRPALIFYRVGEGRCLRFLGDLVDGVRRMRQGNPALADRDMNEKGGIQPSDLFVGQIRPADFARPHADLLVESVLAALRLPFRLHPLPANAPGLTIFTADQDYVPEAGVEAQIEDGAPEALTLLLTDARFGGKPDVDFGAEHPATLSARWASARADDGVELGIHPNLQGIEPSAYAAVLRDQANAFEREYGKRAVTVRNHHLAWQGYTQMAEHQARAAFRMNLDFMALSFLGEGKLGYLNGSGLPLRFIRVDGTVLPIWQQGTQVDDHGLLPPRFGYEAMDVDELIAETQKLMDRSLADPPHPITINHHPVWHYETDGRWQRALLEASRSRAMPIWGAERWLDHQRAMRDTQIARLGPGKLSVTTGGSGVALLLPEKAEVRADGKRLEASEIQIAGRLWARVELPPSKPVVIEWAQ